LTVGDIICIPHGRKQFFLEVREVQPNGAASIIENDCKVDFDEPVGYKESKYAQYEKNKQAEDSKKMESISLPLQKARVEDEVSEKSKFVPFGGSAKRIDGKPGTSQKSEAKSDFMSEPNSKPSSKPSSKPDSPVIPPVPAYQSKIGDKYSTKKAAVAAFAGAARKLG
jgi:ubiquitin fusion degradation protein 1